MWKAVASRGGLGAPTFIDHFYGVADIFLLLSDLG
jgi:hypothetical protein